MRKAYVFKERQRYSIRKYSFGATSVLIGASLMIGGHVLAQEQANSVSSSKDYEVIVNNSEAPQFEQATQEAVTDVLNEPVSKSEAPRPNLTSSEVASVSKSEVASPRSEATSVASSEVASEIDRSATSEVAEARPTDREAVDTSLRTVSTNASHPGADGLVTADVFLDIPLNGTFYFRRTTEIRTAPVMDIKPTFVFSSGDHVIYDKVLKRDNHQWISYVSYNGTRRYVDLGVVVESLAKPRGDMAIESHDNGDFSVVISNVSDQNGVVGVSVPIWSERNGQDDIIQYNATRLNNRNYKVNVGLSDYKNERGLYNVHLYFVETNGKLVGVGGTTYTVPAKVEETHITTGHSLPDSGTYTFKERSIIKAEPSVVSPELAYYDAGMSVNYDIVVTADGHTWLSYVSRGGNRRYIAIDGKATVVAQSASPSLAITGTYTFTKPSSIKAQPSVASPELAYYDKVMSVRYDKVLTADGHTWLSYVTYSGLRRYVVDIS